ncbi:N-6 DNA methylase [Mycobacteroides abscessus]|nr:N-6 DNA methylase [Mycobacteroides abscessus]MDM2549949.1 N-6 DNA methylase [Mycobacteroides abscessus]MDM2558154.1 N-6 DNA methylase [Mycobacteroides abscessus]MDM2563049.1 N-6 DNA methylase [Mycobacteroides abscessus]MDM2578264.1 N-6 DNA methylase [Mycobacteroides abscessus]
MVVLNNEEDVKIHALPDLLKARGYDMSKVAYNQTLKAKQGRKTKDIFADAVVFADDARTLPLVVVETKGPNESLTEGDRDQAVSYARLLPTIAPLALVYNGTSGGTRVYDVFSKDLLLDGLPTSGQAIRRAKKVAPTTDHLHRLTAAAIQETFRFENVEEFKRILRASHNAIRNNEGYDPTKAFDELSKVMFTKLFEERDGKNRFTLQRFDVFSASNVNIINQIFEETKKDKKYSGLFTDSAEIELSERTVRELVKQFEKYDLSKTGFDVKGEAFEHFLGDTFTGGLGQYFTPRNVVEFIVEAVDPAPDDSVIDPFCGTGGFLIDHHERAAGKIRETKQSVKSKEEALRHLGEDCIFGIDWNERTSLACRMNMVVHGEGDSGRHIFRQSGFLDVSDNAGGNLVGDNKFDVCLTNPPFGSAETDKSVLNKFTVSSGRKSIERAALALERAIRLVKPGGHIGIIIMDGILNNSSTASIRKYVLQNAEVLGLVSLPPETFEGYGGRSDTTVLLLRKKEEPDDGQQENDTFMAVCRNSGYAPNGAEIPGNELPEILTQYKQWLDGKEIEGVNVWSCPVEDRLDPKFYWRPLITPSDAPVEEITETVLTVAGNVHAELQSIRDELKVLDDGCEFKSYKLGSLFEEIRNPVVAEPDKSYDLAGVRWWGAGAFIRESKLGREIKGGSRLNKLAEGSLIYNRLFAFRGSFAIVGADCDGAYTSVEFPTFRVREGVPESELLMRYVVHALNSPQYLSVVDAKSSGSTKTSRNRFKQEFFNALPVMVPEESEDLARYVTLLDRLDALRRFAVEVIEGEKVLRQAISGQLPIA